MTQKLSFITFKFGSTSVEFPLFTGTVSFDAEIVEKEFEEEIEFRERVKFGRIADTDGDVKFEEIGKFEVIVVFD